MRKQPSTDHRRTGLETDTRAAGEGLSLINPFSGGVRIETLYYIPPTNKGDVIYGIAGANLSVTGHSIGTPHEQGSIKTSSVRGFAGWSS